MKKLTLLLIAALSLAFANCKTKSKATSSSDNSSGQNTASSDGTKVKCRVVISFISIGSGINGPKYDEIKGFIDKHPKKPAYDEIPAGREGEREVCMSLKEMNSSEQAEFIKELKKMAEGADRVSVSENAERTRR